ncbi:MAG TPA: mechanosensitive ion channel family protein [Gemmatimonadota bacterium]
MELDFTPAVERSREILQGLLASLPNVAMAILTLTASWIVGHVAARLVMRPLARTGAHFGVQKLVGTMTRVVVGLIGLFLALAIVGIDVAPLAAGVGVLGLVAGIALKDPLENFMAGIVLFVRQPYTAGDRIVTTGIEGTVVDVNLRSTIIKTYDGELVHVPNGAILRAPLVNRTAFPVVRSAVDVIVPYDQDLERAMAVVSSVLRSGPDVKPDPAPEVAVVEFGERGVRLQARFWTDSLGATVNRVGIDVRRRLKDAFEREGISFPPPPGVILRGEPSAEVDLGPTR